MIRGEETDGHLEALLVRPLRRSSWFVGRVALAIVVLVVAGVVGGIGTWVGAATQHAHISLGTLITAGLNVVPPALLLLGLGTLTYGAWPRKTTAVVYGYLAWSFLIELAGGLIKISHWLLDTSVFFHMTPAPAANPDWTSAAILTSLRDSRHRPRRPLLSLPRPPERMTNQPPPAPTTDAQTEHRFRSSPTAKPTRCLSVVPS